MIYWHYNNGLNIPRILARGSIRGHKEATIGPSFVWFSKRTDWEPLASVREARRAYKALSPDERAGLEVPSGTGANGIPWHRFSADQIAKLCDGAFRIAVDADKFPVTPWPGCGQSLWPPSTMIAHYEETGQYYGSCPADWAAAVNLDVPRPVWESIEQWRAGSWTEIDEREIPKFDGDLYPSYVPGTCGRCGLARRHAKLSECLRDFSLYMEPGFRGFNDAPDSFVESSQR